MKKIYIKPSTISFDSALSTIIATSPTDRNVESEVEGGPTWGGGGGPAGPPEAKKRGFYTSYSDYDADLW